MCSASSPICMDFPLLIASTLPASDSRDLAPVASIASEVFAYGLVRLLIGSGFRLARVGHRLATELVAVQTGGRLHPFRCLRAAGGDVLSALSCSVGSLRTYDVNVV